MDMKALMQQAQKMQEKMQREIAELKVEASSGGGMVTVTMSGSRELLGVKISPEVVEGGDAEMLEDLVRAAVNEANRKVEEALGQKMGGLKLPGF
ncbi:MAG: YbaB/EbfC family nucleoid-associated protein [Acidobacteria bacterium]|nr:YbaB/EbfC family nucleoid-associated protein [Acidobacteriota bacterium]